MRLMRDQPETAAAALVLELLELFRERGAERLPTVSIVAALGARLGRPLTAHRLARALKPHGVAPRQFRTPGSGRRAWGYCLHDLAERHDADPPAESCDAEPSVGRLDAEHEWAVRVAMAAAMAHRGGRGW